MKLKFIKDCNVIIREFASHPKYDILYVTTVDNIIVTVIGNEIVDFDQYENGYFLIGDYVTEINNDNFIRRMK